MILGAVKGYQISFSSVPPPRLFLREPSFSAQEVSACDTEVERLLQKSAIEEVTPSADQFLSPFFVIKKSSGGMRFILNLRDLNSYITPPHFKLKDWSTVVRLMLPGFKLATIDLEDAYFLIPIHEPFRKFLRFQWRGETYEFTSLSFGLSIAPFIFTKVLRPVVKLLREKGFHSIVYLDDFLLLGASIKECQNNIHASINLLTSLGFLINYNKSQLTPSSRCRYLGFIFDSAYQSIAIPPDKRRKLFSLTNRFSRKSHCTVKEFAELIGSLVSVFPAVQYSPLYTKHFEREKFLALESSSGDYSKQMAIPSYLRTDFEWWLQVLSDSEQYNPIRSEPFVCEIFSDPSLTGWGTSCGEQCTRGWWSPEDKNLHINALDLKAAFYALRCFASGLSNSNILLRIDNTTAISYINKFGSVQYPLLLTSPEKYGNGAKSETSISSLLISLQWTTSPRTENHGGKALTRNGPCRSKRSTKFKHHLVHLTSTFLHP